MSVRVTLADSELTVAENEEEKLLEKVAETLSVSLWLLELVRVSETDPLPLHEAVIVLERLPEAVTEEVFVKLELLLPEQDTLNEPDQDVLGVPEEEAVPEKDKEGDTDALVE